MTQRTSRLRTLSRAAGAAPGVRPPSRGSRLRPWIAAGAAAVSLGAVVGGFAPLTYAAPVVGRAAPPARDSVRSRLVRCVIAPSASTVVTRHRGTPAATAPEGYPCPDWSRGSSFAGGKAFSHGGLPSGVDLDVFHRHRLQQAMQTALSLWGSASGGTRSGPSGPPARSRRSS